MIILIGFLIVFPLLGAQLGIDLDVVSRALAISTRAIIEAKLQSTNQPQWSYRWCPVQILSVLSPLFCREHLQQTTLRAPDTVFISVSGSFYSSAGFARSASGKADLAKPFA